MAPATSFAKKAAYVFIALAACAWVVALAGVSQGIYTSPTNSKGYLRFEWFVLCFELVALCHAAHTLSSSPLSSFPTRRSATLALLSCVTAVSIILTNAKMNEMNELWAAYNAELTYTWDTKVTLEILQGVRVYYAGILCWSAFDLFIILCFAYIGDALAANTVASETRGKPDINIDMTPVPAPTA